jgi:cyclic pyranopterin phosphate synthase
VVSDSSSEPDAREVAEFARQNNLQIRFIRTMDSNEGKFSQVEGGTGGDCPRCNRLRLSANGMVKPCLFSDLGFSVRRLGPKEALRKAIQAKPEAGGPCTNNWIRSVGG